MEVVRKEINLAKNSRELDFLFENGFIRVSGVNITLFVDQNAVLNQTNNAALPVFRCR